MRKIDVNADLGEECGDDAAMLDIVTTANVACGGHAGGGHTMRTTIAAAVSRNVAVGAHPAYPDRINFGRISRFDDVPYDQLLASIRAQIIDAGRALAEHGLTLTHVKPHGALYNDANVRPDVAQLILDAVIDAGAELGYDTPIPLMTMPNTVAADHYSTAGHPVIYEGFIDRLYTPDGLLTPRGEDNAVLHHIDDITAQALALADATVVTSAGTLLPMPVTTLCVHGDTPDAVSFARTVRDALTAHGYTITGDANRP